MASERAWYNSRAKELVSAEVNAVKPAVMEIWTGNEPAARSLALCCAKSLRPRGQSEVTKPGTHRMSNWVGE
jgi:hypothetical protein